MLNFAASRSRPSVVNKRSTLPRRKLFGTAALMVSAVLASSNAEATTLSAPTVVTITRDEYGVPHVFAKDNFGLFYGFGYALAEDRLFQMEMTWRTATGRVAEVLGSEYVATDKASRSNYDPASLRRQFDALPASDQAIFQGYAKGYNVRVDEVLAGKAGLPTEFSHYAFVPHHIGVNEILAIFVHDMAIRFSGYNGEVDNLRLLTSLRATHSRDDADRIFRTLLWDQDAKAPTTISQNERVDSVPPTFESLARLRDAKEVAVAAKLKPISQTALLDIKEGRAASFGEANRNSAPHASLGWVTGRNRTVGASAVLVDGAQMGFTAPSIVWSVGLHGAGFNVVGETQVGVPAVLFGTNGSIAWGGTAGMGDVVDMYQETLSPSDRHQYLFNGQYHEMARRVETIHIKDESDQTIEIFSTVHGIVKAFDPELGAAYSEKRAWSGREIESLLAWLKSGQATDFQQWKKKISHWGLSINWLYADKGGDIGYIYTGRYPDRPADQDFRLPAVGTGSMEWKGLRAFADNPKVFRPHLGWLASWNNLSQPGYRSSDSIYWNELDHVAELQKILSSRSSHTPEQVWDAIEGVSYIDGNARVLKPILLAGLEQARGGELAEARDLLAAWDGTSRETSGNQAAQIIFSQWLRVAQRRLLEHDVPAEYVDPERHVGKEFDSLTDVSWAFPTPGTAVLAHALEGTASGAVQYYDFLHGKAPGAFIRQTMEEALSGLVTKYGRDMRSWREPAPLHEFDTKNFVGVPITTPDHKVTFPRAMNRATFNFRVTFDAKGARMCDVVAPGQSAFRGTTPTDDKHVSDQIQLYRSFTCKPQWIAAKDASNHASTSKSFVVPYEGAALGRSRPNTAATLSAKYGE